MALQVSQANSKSTDYLVKPSALDSGTFPPPDNDDNGRQGYSRGSEKSLASSVPALNDYDEEMQEAALSKRQLGRIKAPHALFVIAHLTIGSQMGTLARFWIEHGLGDYCQGVRAGPDCAGFNAEIRDVIATLFANIVGSFLMGLLTENRAHLLWFEAPHMPLSFLPIDHPIQSYDALLTGLRVGFCGSLTTFASWAAQMVGLAAKGAVFSAAFGFFACGIVSLVSFVIGEQTAVGLHMLLNNIYHKDARNRLWHGINMNGIGGAMSHKHTDAAGGAISVVAGSPGDVIAVWHKDSKRGADGRRQDLEQWAICGPFAVTSCDLRKVKAGPDVARAMSMLMESEPPGGGAEAPFRTVSGTVIDSDTFDRARSIKRLAPSVLHWDIFFAALAVGMVVAWACLVAFDDDYERRSCWLSLLLAPFGCIARWKACSNLNGALKVPKWRWFPLGTFTINIAATCLTCLMTAIQTHLCVGTGHLYWLGVFTGAVKTGFDGSLSTVSTFVAETRNMMNEYPRNHKGWIYVFASVFAAVFVGFPAYAWSVYIPHECKG